MKKTPLFRIGTEILSITVFLLGSFLPFVLAEEDPRNKIPVPDSQRRFVIDPSLVRSRMPQAEVPKEKKETPLTPKAKNNASTIQVRAPISLTDGDLLLSEEQARKVHPERYLNYANEKATDPEETKAFRAMVDQRRKEYKEKMDALRAKNPKAYREMVKKQQQMLDRALDSYSRSPKVNAAKPVSKVAPLEVQTPKNKK